MPDSVEARLVRGETRLTVQVKRADGMEMQDLGMMLHPGLAVGLAWRRSSPGRRQPLPAIRPVSPEAMEIPMRAWPSTWEGLVEHVRQGGSLRVDGRLRGGMDPGLQAVRDRTVLDDSAPRGTLEECFTLVRSGSLSLSLSRYGMGSVKAVRWQV